MTRRPTTPAPALRLHPLVAALAVALPLHIAAQTQRPVAPPPPPPPPGWRVANPTALPVPRNLPAIDPAALPRPADNWLLDGSTATAGPRVGGPGGTQMVIDQTSQRAIYNWASFDIGAQAQVSFEMARPGASALNRIASGAPSQIFGRLSATNGGELYLLNSSGILFGRGAQVDVGALVASTLNLSSEEFKAGLVNSLTTNTNIAPFRYDGRPEDFIDAKNFVRVDEGAAITTREGGRVFLFARRVENAGSIATPGGQTVLAGGSEVVLRLPTDTLRSERDPLYASEANPAIPVTRGLLVEVGDRLGSGATASRNGSGSVLNAPAGLIETARGNATLVGMAVNQSGRISATTSVSESGSVLLLAQGRVNTADTGLASTGYKRAPAGGTLTLGAGSVTEVLPSDLGADGKPLASDDNATFVRSRIELAGRSVELGAAAQVLAPGGTINVRALARPEYISGAAVLRDGWLPEAGAADAVVVIGEGAVIDASGTTSATESAARSFVTTDCWAATT